MDRTDSKIDTPLTQGCSRDVPESRFGWVYFIRAGDAIKIGHSTRLTARLKALQTGTHHSLVLLAKAPGAVQLEREYHDRFRRWHIQGEWFKASRPLLYEIDQINGTSPRFVIRPPRPDFSPEARAHLKVLRSMQRGNVDPVTSLRLGLLIDQRQNFDRETDPEKRALLGRLMARQVDLMSS